MKQKVLGLLLGAYLGIVGCGGGSGGSSNTAGNVVAQQKEHYANIQITQALSSDDYDTNSFKPILTINDKVMELENNINGKGMVTADESYKLVAGAKDYATRTIILTGKDSIDDCTLTYDSYEQPIYAYSNNGDLYQVNIDNNGKIKANVVSNDGETLEVKIPLVYMGLKTNPVATETQKVPVTPIATETPEVPVTPIATETPELPPGEILDGKPHVTLEADKYIGNAPLKVTIDYNAYDSDKDISQRILRIEDENVNLDSNKGSLTHTFESQGEYFVQANIFDKEGNMGSGLLKIIVRKPDTSRDEW